MSQASEALEKDGTTPLPRIYVEGLIKYGIDEEASKDYILKLTEEVETLNGAINKAKDALKE